MARISASPIGKEIGKNAREVNRMLEQIGFIKKGRGVTLKGSPTWDITELGRKYGQSSGHSHSSGYIWDKEVINILRGKFNL